MQGRRSEYPEYGAVREYHDDPYYRKGNTKFSKICDQIKTNVSNIIVGANSLEKLMKMIGTERDSVESRDKIHEVSTKTNKIVQETSRQMKTISSMTGLDRQQKFQVDRLKNDFQEAVQRFTSLQKRAAEQVKKTTKLTSQKPKPKSSGGWMDDDDDEVKFLEQERKREEQQIQDQIIEDDLTLIRDREERIRQLESDILDVNEIFKDLATMVNEQGETIDEVDSEPEVGMEAPSSFSFCQTQKTSTCTSTSRSSCSNEEDSQPAVLVSPTTAFTSRHYTEGSVTCNNRKKVNRAPSESSMNQQRYIEIEEEKLAIMREHLEIEKRKLELLEQYVQWRVETPADHFVTPSVSPVIRGLIASNKHLTD